MNNIIYRKNLPNLDKIKQMNIDTDDPFLEELNIMLKKKIMTYKIDYFKILPDEIINKIIQNIDIRKLFRLKLISRRWYFLIKEHIEKNIIYVLKINVNKHMKELNMCIQCDRCLKFQELSNKYKTISIFYEDYFSCCLCRYKSVYDISDIKYINHFIIDFYDDNSGLTKPPKYLKEKEKQMYNYLYDIIHFFYNNYNIYISEFNYSGINDKDYKNDVFSKILNNTKYKANIFVSDCNFKTYDKNIEIINPDLKIISIPSILIESFKKVDLKNIEEVYINDTDIHNIDTIDNEYINNILRKKVNKCNNLFDKINKDLINLSLSNNLSFNFNKKIKILEICLDPDIDKNIKNIINYLIEIKKKYNIEKLLLFLINSFEEYTKELYNCPFVDKILFYGDFDFSMYSCCKKDKLEFFHNY